MAKSQLLFLLPRKVSTCRAFLLVCLFCGALAAQSIPHVQTDTLSEHKITLPDAALGHPAIFNIGFSRAGGDSTQRWGRELRKELSGNAGLNFFSVAVLQDAPKMVRGMIRHGMRSSVPKNEQDTFVLIYDGEQIWKDFAGFSNPDEAYIVLVDAKGAVLARVHGKTPDPSAIATLKDALVKIAPQ